MRRQTVSSEFWGNKDFVSGEFVQWEEGTEVIGLVVKLGTHTFEANERGPARTVPLVVVKDDAGHETEITCGPADLKKKMVAAAPSVGDRIKVECIGENKTALGMQRFFKVSVQRRQDPRAGAAGADRYTAPKAEVNELILPADAEPPF